MVDKKLKMLLRNSKFLSVERLQRELARVITSYKGFGMSIWENFEPGGLYRARQHNHLEGELNDQGELSVFHSELEFWNAPIKKCYLGRCNNESESMFYCTNEFEVAIQEVKPYQEYITVANFIPKPKQLQRSIATAIPIGIEYLKDLTGLQKFFTNYVRNERYAELDDFLNSIFYLDVPGSKSYFYKLSTAVTKNFMNPIQTDNGIVQMQGLVYSSMARDKKGFNIVFKPQHVVDNYYLSGVQTHRILENTEEKITLQLVRNGHPKSVRYSMQESSDMNWFEPLDNGEIFTFDKKKFC